MNHSHYLHSVDEVSKVERAEIAAQRALRQMPGDPNAPLVGLALSGGGVRSATFSLGVLQTLSRLELPMVGGIKRPLIDFIDYLSTVSGGGHIGSWFVANRRREMCEQRVAGTSFLEPTRWETDTDRDTEQVAHLRRYSQSIKPEIGLLNADTWTFVASWLEGFVFRQAMVFCVVASCFMLPHLWLRVVNGIPWLLERNDHFGPLVQANDGVMSFRWLEGLLPLAILGCLFQAYRQAKKEIRLFIDDKKVDSGCVNAASIKPIDQTRVQVRIVLPAVTAALLTTAWLWLHHVRLNAQETWIAEHKIVGGGLSILDWLAPSAQVLESWWVGADPGALFNAASMRDWWRGVEQSSILASPWMLALTFIVVLMAHRLMWLMEDQEAQNQCGGSCWMTLWKDFRDRLASLFSTSTPKPQSSRALNPSWKVWLEQLKHAGLRRTLSFLTLMWGSLLSLYVIDETLRFACSMQFGPNIPIGVGIVAVICPAMILLGLYSMVILSLLLAGRRLFDDVRSWWTRLGAWLMIYGLSIGLFNGLVLLGPTLIEFLFQWSSKQESLWAPGGLIATSVATFVFSLFIGKGAKAVKAERIHAGLNFDNAALFALCSILLGIAWFVRFMLTPEGFSPHDDPLLLNTLNYLYGGWARFWLVFGGLVSVATALVWRCDLNEFSISHFYRNRLARCYLGGATHLKNDRCPHPFTGFEFRDDQPLAGFTAACGHPGPYPLINTALNTSQGGDLDVQERKAESFVLSPLYCGSHRRRPTIPEKEKNHVSEGYRPTPYYMSGLTASEAEHDADGESDDINGFKSPLTGIKLGTAFSISGAAASPNSGYHTSSVLAFLMTIFNVRLGWWVPNPAKRDWMLRAPTFPGFLKHLFFELFGCATPDASFVYLSDGGHFENLGIYELVRRQCRFIIAVDGDEDGEFSFQTLGTSIRRCRVDFAVEIEINVEDIRPDADTGLSGRHCAVGIIRYPNGASGTLLYIKASLTGDESADISLYKKISPTFPHEPTENQFFQEPQFESYRKLGQHAAGQALAPLRRMAITAGCSDDPTKVLRNELLLQWHYTTRVSKESANHRSTLNGIWATAATPGVPPCICDIVLPREHGHPPLSMPENAEERHQVICFSQRLIQLMDSVCLDLQLKTASVHPDHIRWVQLFRNWANHPVLNEIWKVSMNVYSTQLADLWEDLRSWPPS
jgi:predicted acylesterase/phospholipase RssA